MNFSKKDIADWACGEWSDSAHCDICGFCYDSRICANNDCFLAISSEKDDGHRYLSEARINGATAAIVERYEANALMPQLIVHNTLKAFQNIGKNYRKTLSTNIIGVTGSCGKTTAKEFLGLLLGDRTFKTQKNYNNGIGVPLSLTQIESINHDNAVIEVGINSVGEMDILTDILAPDAACVLNVEAVHIGRFFDDIDTLANEKAKILKNSKLRFFNKTLLRFDCFRAVQSDSFVISECNPAAGELTYVATEIDRVGWRVVLFDGFGQIGSLIVPFLIGSEALYTFVFAIFVAIKLGVSLNKIQDRLVMWSPVDKRGVWSGKFFVDCYNANPVSMLASMSTFRKQADRDSRHLYIVGQMGELGTNSGAYHYELGKNIKARPDDLFWVVGLDHAVDVFNGLIAAGFSSKNVVLFDSVEAIDKASLKNFDGKVFLKGSRYHKLERLIC